MAGRYQKGGATVVYPMPMPAARGDFWGVSADLLFEKNLGSFGAATFEAALYTLDFDDVVDPLVFPLGTGTGGYVLGAWLFPWQLWLGKLQASVRYQLFEGDDLLGRDRARIDGVVNYLVAGHATRVGLLVARDEDVLIVKLGAQLIL